MAGVSQWRRYTEWPPAQAQSKTLHFHPGGLLSFDAAPPAAAEFDEYISDPAKPVPYIPNIAISMTREHMTDDQVRRKPSRICPGALPFVAHFGPARHGTQC